MPAQAGVRSSAAMIAGCLGAQAGAPRNNVQAFCGKPQILQGPKGGVGYLCQWLRIRRWAGSDLFLLCASAEKLHANWGEDFLWIPTYVARRVDAMDVPPILWLGTEEPGWVGVRRRLMIPGLKGRTWGYPACTSATARIIPC